jgi:hypothetical protein
MLHLASELAWHMHYGGLHYHPNVLGNLIQDEETVQKVQYLRFSLRIVTPYTELEYP